ncbi:hypothetical protein [Gordonia sp. WA4-43]|nr:hypothetical protein [Gordonia sp. WA4-43]UCZ89855.1 hypothetical protein LEL84_23105 [Gordonia sp. WA4-43]
MTHGPDPAARRILDAGRPHRRRPEDWPTHRGKARRSRRFRTAGRAER